MNDIARRSYDVVAVDKTVELQVGPLGEPYAVMVMTRKQCLHLATLLKEAAIRISEQ